MSWNPTEQKAAPKPAPAADQSPIKKGPDDARFMENGIVMEGAAPKHFAPEALQRLTQRFLQWQLPASVQADACVTMPPDERHSPRYGTNLLTYGEAYQMLEHVLTGTKPFMPLPNAAPAQAIEALIAHQLTELCAGLSQMDALLFARAVRQYLEACGVVFGTKEQTGLAPERVAQVYKPATSSVELQADSIRIGTGETERPDYAAEMADLRELVAQREEALDEAAAIIRLMVGGHHDDEAGWKRVACFLAEREAGA